MSKKQERSAFSCVVNLSVNVMCVWGQEHRNDGALWQLSDFNFLTKLGFASLRLFLTVLWKTGTSLPFTSILFILMHSTTMLLVSIYKEAGLYFKMWLPCISVKEIITEQSPAGMLESFQVKNYRGTTELRTFTVTLSLISFPFLSPRKGLSEKGWTTLTLNTCNFVPWICISCPVKSLANHTMHTWLIRLLVHQSHFGPITVLILISANGEGFYSKSLMTSEKLFGHMWILRTQVMISWLEIIQDTGSDS